MNAGPELVTTCGLCGYEFPERLGKYGCPNCLGEGPDEAERMDEWDPTGYYRRKLLTRTPAAAWSALGLLAVLVAWAISAAVEHLTR